MKSQIYKFFILLCQFIHGRLVMKMEYSFTTELIFIILPFSILVAVLFELYDKETKNNY